VRGYGRCAIGISYSDIKGNGIAPAVSIDERQNLDDDPSEDAAVFIRQSVGDITSDPPSRKWAVKATMENNYLTGDQLTISAIIGQAIEV